MKLGDQDKSWAPHKMCKHCTETLCFWTQGKVSSMRFGVPMVWREPKNHHHHDDCYFCTVDMSGWNQRKKIDIILILSLLDDPYHIALKFQFQFSLPYLTLLQLKCYWKRWDDSGISDSSSSSSSSMAAAASLLSAKTKFLSQGQLN